MKMKAESMDSQTGLTEYNVSQGHRILDGDLPAGNRRSYPLVNEFPLLTARRVTFVDGLWEARP